MTGHQAEFWHAGILAKFLAAEAYARVAGAATAWFVVDQDDNDAGFVRYPAKNGQGRLTRAMWRAGPRGGDGVATACQPPMAAQTPAIEPPALPCVAEGLARIGHALRESRDAPSVARQVTRANRSLFSGHAAPAAVVYASEIGATEAFAGLVDRLGREAERACQAYNAAALAHPKARLRPLSHDAQRGWELPLWRLEFGKPREAVFARELAKIDKGQLAPRALLATGVMRLWACDLFIHGAGGAKYDAATDAWLEAWLGAKPPAPSTMVTATLRLPFDASDVVDPEHVAAAKMLAHRARHHPALLGDTAAQRERDAMLEQVKRSPRKSMERTGLYRRLHELLATSRAQNEPRLATLRDEAKVQAVRRAEAGIIYDRTWPAALHPEESISRLASDVSAAFTGA